MYHSLPFHVIPVLSASTWKNFYQNNTPYTSAPLLSSSLGMKAQHYLISEFGGKGRIALSLLSALLFLVKKKSSLFCFLASSSKDTQQAKTCDRKILNKSFGDPIKIPFSIQQGSLQLSRDHESMLETEVEYQQIHFKQLYQKHS